MGGVSSISSSSSGVVVGCCCCARFVIVRFLLVKNAIDGERLCDDENGAAATAKYASLLDGSMPDVNVME